MKVVVELLDLVGGDANEATVSCWHFEEDEEVNEGEDLVEMLTDKSTFSITAPVSGRLVEILAQEGDVVKIGDVVAILETGEEEEEEGEEDEED